MRQNFVVHCEFMGVFWGDVLFWWRVFLEHYYCSGESWHNPNVRTMRVSHRACIYVASSSSLHGPRRRLACHRVHQAFDIHIASLLQI